MRVDDETRTLTELVEATGGDSSELQVTFDINADGTFTGNTQSDGGEGTWEAAEDGTYRLTIEGDTQIARLENGKMILSINDNAEEMIFEKKS